MTPGKFLSFLLQTVTAGLAAAFLYLLFFGIFADPLVDLVNDATPVLIESAGS